MQAYITAPKSSVIKCRVFDPLQNRWWTGSVWSSSESAASLTTLTATTLLNSYEDRYTGTVTIPAGSGLIVEYVDSSNNVIIGSDPADSYVPDNAGIAAIKLKTDTLPTSPANQTTLLTVAGQTAQIPDVKTATDKMVSAYEQDGAVYRLSQNALENAPLPRASDAGTGNTVVNHDWGGTDNLRCVTAAGIGIDNCDIVIYLSSAYQAGNLSGANVVASTKTRVDGRWDHPVYLDAGFSYTVVAYKQGEFEPEPVEITL